MGKSHKNPRNPRCLRAPAALPTPQRRGHGAHRGAHGAPGVAVAAVGGARG
jgi:hypothetical protein